MKFKITSCIFFALALMQQQAYAEHEIELDEISVTETLDSRIINHPATVETYYKQQIQDTVNATTSAQTLKYLPSFQVRERYIGDRNGPIATRTTGTLSSAQTMLYADGVLLSNLLGNSYSFPPRWGFVSPEEIESVSILYGPFSALYAGNSFGGVVNLNTRMPTKFEAHASAQTFMQNFELYGTDKTSKGNHETASIGNKINDLSFLFTVDRLESDSQPMQFANALRSSTAPGGAPIVTGAYQDKDQTGKNRVIFGATGFDSSEQTNAKIKLAYDLTPQIKASYSLGIWDLNSKVDVESYLKDAATGNTVYNGQVNFNGASYNVSGFSPSEAEALHIMQALDVKSNTKGFFDWQLTLSDYDYQKDKNAASNGTTAIGNPYVDRTGRVTDLQGTGWTVFDARGTLRPVDGFGRKHLIDIGYHIDDYQLRSDTNNTADWSQGTKGSLFASSRGETQTQALYVQDKWQINPEWALTLGGRQEYWQAKDGRNQNTSTTNVFSTANYASQSENKFSPKVSLSFEPEPAWGFRAAVGQAFRFPTVSELYQQLSQGSTVVENNPNLKPEEVISGEFTAERRFANGLLRATLFHESKYDALISQTLGTGSNIPFGNGTCAGTCSFIQNIDHVRTNGIELSTIWENVWIHGLDLLANATFTDAEILKNTLDPTTEGNKPVRIPKQQYKVVATYHQGHNLTYSVAARYSGRQYNTLDNSDVNPDTFGGTSKYFFVDVKANYKFADRMTASIGIDNLNNYSAYVFHPYPQRTGYLQLKFDY
ncbi:MAG TPA: TonB-dependent receptor [Methylotenera sp.]|nr:TonB-dependent receptor [Methylotenera sp.]